MTLPVQWSADAHYADETLLMRVLTLHTPCCCQAGTTRSEARALVLWLTLRTTATSGAVGCPNTVSSTAG